VITSIVYETRYPGRGEIMYHVDCFQGIAGKNFIDNLHKKLQESDTATPMDWHVKRIKKDEVKNIMDALEEEKRKPKKKRWWHNA